MSEAQSNPLALLSPELVEQLRREVNQESAKFITSGGLTNAVKRALSGVVLQLLGITQKYGELTLSDRGAAQLEQLLDCEVNKRVKRYLDKLTAEAVHQLERDRQLQSRLIAKLVDRVESQLQEQMRQTGTGLAKRLGNQLEAQINNMLLGDPQQLVNGTDPADPSCYDGPLGQLMLKQLARRLLKSSGKAGPRPGI